jgi:hypothetical protein
MDHKIVYNKDQKLEEVDDKIADILSSAIYSYIIRKGLLKNVNQSLQKFLDKGKAK